MSAEEAASHPQRSILLSALTGRPISLIDERSIRLDGSDRFLLASDGLLSLSGSEIAAIASELDDAEPGRLVAALLAAVEAKGQADQDNCTIVVIRGASPTRRRSRARGITFLAFGMILLVSALAVGLWKWNHPRPAPAGVSGPGPILPAPRSADVSGRPAPRSPAPTVAADPAQARGESTAAKPAKAKPAAAPRRPREKP